MNVNSISKNIKLGFTTTQSFSQGLTHGMIVVLTASFLVLSACGKKKEAVENRAPEASAQTQNKEAAPAPLDPKTTVETQVVEEAKNGRDNVDETRGHGVHKESKKQNKVVVGADGKVRKKLNIKGHGSNAEKGGSSSKSNVSTSNSNAADKNGNKKPDTGALVGSDVVTLTNATSELGYLYTGASKDSILTQLVAQENAKSPEQVKLNKKLASSITKMAYQVDENKNLQLEMTLNQNDSEQKIKVELPFSALNQVSSDITVESYNDLTISALCLDSVKVSSDCANLLVKLNSGKAVAKAILRKSFANIYYSYEPVTTTNSDYADLIEFFENAKLDYQVDNRLNLAYLNTFEVVNGKSGFNVVLKGNANQVLAFDSELLVRKDLSPSFTEVNKTELFKSYSVGLAMVDDRTKDMNYQRMIESVKLIQNNGQGQITLKLKVLTSVGETKGIKIKVSRNAVPASL